MPVTSHPVRQMVELAAMLAHESSAWLAQPRLAHASLTHYWQASQSRNDLWVRFLGAHKSQVAAESDSTGRPPWLGWVEEIAISEMVTRVWTAVTVARDVRRGEAHFSPIVRRVFGNHLEARRRAFALLLACPHHDPAAMVSIQQTYRRVERWTDLLLGYVMQWADVSEFAHVPERARDHCEGLRFESRQMQGHYTWPLVRASLRSTFDSYQHVELPNPAWNLQVERSILASGGAGMVDCIGQLGPIWQSRMTFFADDAEKLLAELLAT